MVPRLVTYTVKTRVDRATLLSKLECAPLQAALLPVEDLFNDNISYKLETYADLKRLAPLLPEPPWQLAGSICLLVAWMKPVSPWATTTWRSSFCCCCLPATKPPHPP